MKYITKILFIIILIITIIFTPKIYAKQISVKTPAGESIVLELESSDTIEAVKVKIFEVDNSVPVERLKLIYDGKELEEGRTLADYGINETSTIILEYIEEEKIESPIQNEENPNTSDNIIGSTLLLTTSIIGFILSTLYYKNKLIKE